MHRAAVAGSFNGTHDDVVEDDDSNVVVVVVLLISVVIVAVVVSIVVVVTASSVRLRFFAARSLSLLGTNCHACSCCDRESSGRICSKPRCVRRVAPCINAAVQFVDTSAMALEWLTPNSCALRNDATTSIRCIGLGCDKSNSGTLNIQCSHIVWRSKTQRTSGLTTQNQIAPSRHSNQIGCIAKEDFASCLICTTSRGHGDVVDAQLDRVAFWRHIPSISGA
jgi:hypothetical protein